MILLKRYSRPHGPERVAGGIVLCGLLGNHGWSIALSPTRNIFCGTGFLCHTDFRIFCVMMDQSQFDGNAAPARTRTSGFLVALIVGLIGAIAQIW